MNKLIVQKFIFICILVLLPYLARTSDLKDYYIITDSIVMLHFDDGYIEYHGPGEAAWNHDKAFNTPLDLAAAMESSSYSIQSIDDSNYSDPETPLSISRKSKGGDFSPVNNTVIIYEHWIYLKLPHPLQAGKTYGIATGSLAKNTDSLSFVYEPNKMYSPTIHTNIIAYSTLSDLKFGYVYQWMGDGGSLNLDAYENNNFYLLDDASRDTFFTGILSLRKDIETGEPDTYNNNDSPYYTMADVYQCDFSEFNEPGEYVLYVEQIGCSHPFEIKEDAYRDAFRHTAWGLYHQRSGPERGMPESSWPKGVDHMPGVDGFTIEYSNWRIMDGSNAFDELPAHATGEVFPTNPGDWMPEDPSHWGWGGYFDAGDFDRRHAHMVVSEYLLLAYELKPENFVDNELRIPERDNDIPDIIDEARWAIDMHRRLQGPTGGICGGMEENEHPRPGQNSVTDNRPWFVYAEDPQASYHLAAANAQLAWCLALAGDVSETDSLISQAERVYRWASENMRENDEEKVKEFRMRAASWLYRYTGKAEYHNQFLRDQKNGVEDELAEYCYILNEHPDVYPQVKEDLKFKLFDVANKRLKAGKQRADRWANFDLWGFHRVGGATTPYIFPLILTWELTGIKEYLDYAYTTADYFMGGNPLNMVYVTGLGENHVENILHLDSWFDGVDPMVPGIVPYGLHTYGTWMDGGSGNVYQPLGNFETCYPDWREWPSHEMWFENRYLIIQNEFTVQQTQGPATAAYAYLSSNIHPADVPLEELNINFDTLDLFTGNSIRLIGSLSPYDAERKALLWTSENEEVAKVDNGIVDIVGEGEVYVYLGTEDGKHRDSCLIRAQDYVSVTGIEILNGDMELIEGHSDSLEVTVYPENATNQEYSVEVEDPEVATVSKTGIINALKTGTTLITVTTSESAYSDDIKLTVLQDNTSIQEKNSPPRIWPNPCQGQFFVRTADIPASSIGIKLSDAEGKTIFKRDFDISNRELISVNMGQRSPGIYFVSIYTDEILYSPAARLVVD